MTKLLNSVLLIFGMFFVFKNTFAQSCDSTYFSLVFKGRTYNNITRCAVTANNEVIAIGNEQYYDSWMAKLTGQGNILWSSEYIGDYFVLNNYYRNIQLRDIAMSSDSSSLIVGSVMRGPLRIGVLFDIDKYGNVRWGKTIPYADALTNAAALSDGSFVVYSSSEDQYGKIFHVSSKGDVGWLTTIATSKFKGSAATNRYMKQISDGSIVVGDVVYYKQADTIAEEFFHFYAISTAGDVLWDASYQYPLYSSDFLPDIIHVSELPDKKLSFITSVYLSGNQNQNPVLTGVNMITQSNGDLYKIISYSSDSAATQIIDAKDDGPSNSQVLLVNEGATPTLIKIDPEGSITWKQGYGRASQALAANCFVKTASGYALFMSTPSSRIFQVLLTDPAGGINCSNTPASVSSKETTWSYLIDSVHTAKGAPNGDFAAYSYNILSDNYPLDKTTDCSRVAGCCTDVIDSVKALTLCEGTTLRLGDNTEVKDSGNYYVYYKSAGGCDSIAVFAVKLVKNPKDLMLVKDTCLHGNDSLTLSASRGFANYYWMNDVTNQPDYTVFHPGTYMVRVNNDCGSKTDTVNVYNECDFPVYIPNAFSPNGDGLNDVFKVPEQNKDVFLELKIFNRWGQLIFDSEKQNIGWDGTYKSAPQPADVYIYYASMRGLGGKKIIQKGTVLLIR